MSKIILQGGRLIDPETGLDETGDLVIEDGRVLALATAAEGVDATPSDTPPVSGQLARGRAMMGTLTRFEADIPGLLPKNMLGIPGLLPRNAHDEAGLPPWCRHSR